MKFVDPVRFPIISADVFLPFPPHTVDIDDEQCNVTHDLHPDVQPCKPGIIYVGQNGVQEARAEGSVVHRYIYYDVNEPS